MANTHTTSIHAEAHGLGNRFRITVIGWRGEFRGVRTTWAEARATAAHYARLLDAPRQVLGDV